MMPFRSRSTFLAAPLAAALVLGAGLGGCAGIQIAPDGEVVGTGAAANPARGAQARSTPHGAQASAGPAVRRASGPPACARPITEFEEVLANDRRIGHLNGFNHGRIVSALEPARSTCAAGQVRDANRQLAEVRQRHGYR